MLISERFVLYVLEGAPAGAACLPPGYRWDRWLPSLRRPVPPTLGVAGAVWTAFHHFRLFANRDFQVVYVRHGDRIVHRSCVLPRYFRWPFMNDGDLHVSSTWTEPDHRGKGLATAALAQIARSLEGAGRRIWYVSREANLPSIRVCKHVGFRFAGYGKRTSRCGLRCLGQLNAVAGLMPARPGERTTP